jgi:hypothetical protein
MNAPARTKPRRLTAEARAEIFARFARELSEIIEQSVGTPEEHSKFVRWARVAEPQMLAEVARLRSMS